MIYNSTLHAATGYSAYFLVHGTEGKLPIDIILNTTDEEEVEGVDQG